MCDCPIDWVACFRRDCERRKMWEPIMVGDPDYSNLVWNDVTGWQPKQPSMPKQFYLGCICPPTSEQTCQNPMCPRKGVDFTKFGNT